MPLVRTAFLVTANRCQPQTYIPQTSISCQQPQTKKLPQKPQLTLKPTTLPPPPSSLPQNVPPNNPSHLPSHPPRPHKHPHNPPNNPPHPPKGLNPNPLKIHLHPLLLLHNLHHNPPKTHPPNPSNPKTAIAEKGFPYRRQIRILGRTMECMARDFRPSAAETTFRCRDESAGVAAVLCEGG